jgi:hypothetical protein
MADIPPFLKSISKHSRRQASLVAQSVVARLLPVSLRDPPTFEHGRAQKWRRHMCQMYQR